MKARLYNQQWREKANRHRSINDSDIGGQEIQNNYHYYVKEC